jgi:rod shape-determining protein MreC
MAIIANRAKYKSLFTVMTFALPSFFRRLSLLFFILLSLQLIYISPEDPIRNTALEFSGDLSSVVTSGFNFVAREARGASSNLEYLGNLREENIALKLELARLKSIEQQVSILENENKSLKSALQFANEVDYDVVSARLISLSTGGYSGSTIVQAGSNQGVSKDQIVTSKNVMVGRVIEVSQNYSKVMLVTDFGSKIPVISSHSRRQSIVAGTGDGVARALYLPEYSGVQVGETMITSGDGKHYPAGLIVGKVSRIKNGEVYMTPLVDLSSLDFVSILKVALTEGGGK